MTIAHSATTNPMPQILRVWKPQGDDVDMNAFESAVEMQPFNRAPATLCFITIERVLDMSALEIAALVAVVVMATAILVLLRRGKAGQADAEIGGESRSNQARSQS